MLRLQGLVKVPLDDHSLAIIVHGVQNATTQTVAPTRLCIEVHDGLGRGELRLLGVVRCT